MKNFKQNICVLLHTNKFKMDQRVKHGKWKQKSSYEYLSDFKRKIFLSIKIMEEVTKEITEDYI